MEEDPSGASPIIESLPSIETDNLVSKDVEPELSDNISQLLMSARENERIENMDFAAVLYREVLKTLPDNVDALRGLERCRRSLGK